MGQLAINLVRHRAFLEHHDDRTGFAHHRCDIQIDQLFLTEFWRGQIDAIFIHRRFALPHLIDQRQKRAAERNEARNLVFGQMRCACPEKGFRLPVGKRDLPRLIDQNDRVLHGIEDGHGQRLTMGSVLNGGLCHAASLRAGIDAPFSKTDVRRRITSAGSRDIMMAALSSAEMSQS
ncbi:hypothetical protein D3C73_831770 [compost metagenome]